MVVNATEHGMQADVIFVIEGTAANGAYFNDLKTNYLIPTLEYFNQGNIEEQDYFSEYSGTRYGLVVYHAADCSPRPCTETFGPYSNPHKLLQRLDNLEMVGGRGESHANIAEGLATALVCFEDLQLEREPSTASQKHCILVCNSPPYQISVQESYKFLGYTIESLPPLFRKRNINLSIVSPRKIPEFYKLLELALGDSQSSQIKNYAKDPRNLVLLHNYDLRERAENPTNVTPVHTAAANTVQIPSSPVPVHDSPNTNQPNANIPQHPAPQNPAFRNATPMNIGVNQGAAPAMTVPMNPGRPVFNPQTTAPPNYHPARAQQPRWRAPFIAPGATVQSNNQGSALIAQLTQPPTALTGINVPFNQRMDANGMQPSAPAPQAPQQNQQAQLTPQQQQQIRNMYLQQQQQQQMQQQQIQQQQIQQQQIQQQQLQQQQLQQQTMQTAPMTAVSSTGTSGPTPGQQTVTQTTAAAPQHQPVVAGAGQATNRERLPIWQGILEWHEKSKNPTDTQKQIRQVLCQVTANAKDNEPELKADSWPRKLIMQLMPKQLIGSIGGGYLKNSKSVAFHPTPCEALDFLTKVLSSGFAGCVHFSSAAASPACEIVVLLLFYSAEKRAYLGFIPNDQAAFVDRLRKVIHQKSNPAASRGQVFSPSAGGASGPSTATSIPPQMPPAGGIVSQGGIMMSQTNTMTMGGGQITQVPTQPQGLANQQPNQGQMNLQGAMAQQGVENSGAGMISGHQQQQRQMYENNFEAARQQNLMKIHQLRQTLEAAQQQEAQYKSQFGVNVQQNLEAAQQQEMQFKQQIEAQQQAQRGLNPNAGMAGQQPNTQRMMRPVTASNLQLRHLLQQQHNPQQYRQQVLGMQQQMVGPRGQMNVRPINNNNQPNQQFDDVSNYDFNR